MIAPAPLARVRARGAPRARRVGPLLVMLLSCFLCLVLGRRDPGALRQELFVCRGCPFRVAPWALTRTFCSPPQVFFLLGPRGPASELECVTPSLNGFTYNDMSYITRDPPSPPESPRFYVLKGGMLCVFYWGFGSRQCVARTLFFLGSVFVIHFRERTFVFVVLMPPCVFQCCFAYVFACCWAFCSRKCPAKILFFLGLVFEIHFRERTFCFCCLDAALCFSVVFCLCFCIFVGFSVTENAWQKFSSS